MFRLLARLRDALSRPGTTKPLVLAFGGVWLLMAALGLINLYALAENNARMETLVSQHKRKADLVHTLRSITRERALLVHTMLASPDPFARDRLMLRFRDYASAYVRAQEALHSLPFQPRERALFEESQRKIRVSTRLMEQVVELALEGRDVEAQALLVDAAIPAQGQAQQDFDALVEYEEGLIEAAVAEARRAYRNTFAALALLGLASLLSGLAIASAVIRRTAAVERALAEEKERAEITLHSIADAVITTDAMGRINHLNDMAERLTGWSVADARGRQVEAVYRVMSQVHPSDALSAVASCLLDGEPRIGPDDLQLTSRHGQQYAITQSVAAIRDPGGEVIGAIVVFRDVTRERALSTELAWQASHDRLTGLANRHEFERRAQELVEGARVQKLHHALLFLDLDQFKVVNDTCGHGAGDELLCQLAAVLATQVRAVDTLARLGGDEFGVLLSGCNIEQAQQIAEKLRRAISDFRFVWHDKSFAVGVSIGLVEITPEADSLAGLLSAADAACYMAKNRGRNRVYVHRAQDAEIRQLFGEAEWVTRITRAFEEQRFRLYYQRIRPARAEGRPEHCEVLLRMIDETGQVVPPMAFIPAAERYTLMPTLDRWVVRTFFAWLTASRPVLPDAVRFCINLSGQTLSDEAFVGFIQEQFAASGFPPSRMGFEITETAAIANLSQAMTLMGALKELGCMIALDDFGAGMSSFAYLKTLPVDSIKIDGAFVRDMLNDPMDNAMVEAIVRIGRVMGLTTIAEYVEHADIAARLTHLGVDYLQGYAIHEPEPLAAPVAAQAQSA